MTEALPVIVLLSVFATYIWRFFGVALSTRINPDGEVFQWLGCVAYAMLAGLMARVMIFPVGLLADTTMSTRGIAMGCGFAVFFATKRSFFTGTLTAVIVFYWMTAFGITYLEF